MTSHCFGSSTISAPIRFDIFIRTGSLSTPMMNDAPISLAPAVEQRPIGPCANTTTVSPMRMFADSAPLKPVDAISASNTTCSSVSSSGIFARFA